MNQQISLIADGLTDPGVQRQNNEDSWVGPPPDLAPELAAAKGYLYIVADGVGGHQGGAVASKMAVKIAMETYYADQNPDIAASLPAAILEANRQIYRQGISNSEQFGMSTTLTAAVVHGDQLVVANVGDSRAYMVRNGQTSQLTTDHTWVEERRQAGVLTDEEAANHPQRNVITRSLGSDLNVDVDVFPYQIAQGDHILLCSDGLSDLVSAQEIAAVVGQSRGPTAAVRQLVEMAKQRNAPDNVTAVLVSMGRARVGGLVGGRSFHSALVLGGIVGGVLLLALVALLVGRFLLPKTPLWSPKATKVAEVTDTTVTPEETYTPMQTLIPLEPPKLTGPEDGAAFFPTDEIVLTWEWGKEPVGNEIFAVLVKDEADNTRIMERVDISEFRFTPGGRGLDEGATYTWTAAVVKVVEDEPKPVTDWAELRTFQVKHSPTPAPPPTPEPVATAPELLSPAQGLTFRNPISFTWEGALGAGQAYQVIAWHVDEQEEGVASSPMQVAHWEEDLPGEKFGEWHWQVRVVQGDTIVAVSEERMFWFQPILGGNGNGDDKPKPTVVIH